MTHINNMQTAKSILLSQKSLELLSDVNNYEEWTEYVTQHPVIMDVYRCLYLEPQPIKWHPEYCTWHHTFLVAASAVRKGWLDLVVPAVFHDWGKEATTLVKRDTISAYGHARESEKWMREVQTEICDNEDEFEEYAWIVKRHMDFDLTHKRFREYNNYSHPENYEALERFEICDKHMSRGLFWESHNSVFQYHAHQGMFNDLLNSYKNSKNTIHMMVGVPASGKTTFIDKYHSTLLNNAPVFSRDDIRRELYGDVNEQGEKSVVKDIFMKRSIEALHNHNEVVLDGTHCFPNQRYDMFLDYGVAKRIGYIFDVDPDEAEIRVTNDIKNGVDRANVDRKIIDKFQKGMRYTMKAFPPQEFHEIYVINEHGEISKWDFKRNEYKEVIV